MKSVFRPFPLPLTGRQKFYLFFLQGFMAGIIDAGANFGIAYAMYSKQTQVKLWIFDQNTIAGDLGVTPIIQTLISMLISSTLVHTDLHNSKIRPLAFCYPHVENLPDPRTLFGKSITQSEDMRGVPHPHPAHGEVSTSPSTRRSSELDEKSSQPSTPSSKGVKYYYWMLVRFIFEGTEQNMLAARPGFRAWLGRLAWTAAQGAAIGIVFGFPLWCLFIVILGPIYGMGNIGGTWAPQIIKGVYGAVVGWVTNPVIAILALGSQAEQSLVVVEVDEESGTATAVDPEEGQEELADEGVATIREGEVFQPPKLAGSLRRTSANSLRINPPQSPSRPNRSRAGSGTSSLRSASIHSRPPLTAHASYLSPLPSPVDILSPSTGRMRARSNAQAQSITLGPPASPAISRQRGATVSYPSAPSPALQPGSATGPSTPRIPLTPRTFSYALGGTGGRAQRSRSASVVSQVPSVMLSPQLGEAERDGPPGTPLRAWDVFGGRRDGGTGAVAVQSQGQAKVPVAGGEKV